MLFVAGPGLVCGNNCDGNMPHDKFPAIKLIRFLKYIVYAINIKGAISDTHDGWDGVEQDF